MVKLVWKITYREGGICRTWFCRHYLQKGNFWNIRAKTNDSWAWRNIVKIRAELLEQFENANSAKQVMALWQNVLFRENSWPEECMSYDKLRGKGRRCWWSKTIWDSVVMLRRSYVAWLTAHNRIPSSRLRKDGLHSCMDKLGTVSCVHREPKHVHNYMLQMLSVIKFGPAYHSSWILKSRQQGLKYEWSWFHRAVKGKATKVRALRCDLCATIYLVWQLASKEFHYIQTAASFIVYRVKFCVCNRL